MAVLTIAEVLDGTDRDAAIYDAAVAALAPVLALVQDYRLWVYGDGSTVYGLPDSNAIDSLGPSAKASEAAAAGNQFPALMLAKNVAAMSNYLQAYGGADPSSGLPNAVRDLTSYLRYSNGCPDPSPAGGGSGSDYTHLAHPSYAAFVAAQTGGASVLPTDVAFAPTGLVLAQFATSGGVFTAGLHLMTPETAPYAPAKGWRVQAGATPPDGSLYVVLTGVNQAGATVTWRGDADSGLAGAGSVAPANTLKGTDGGAGGGTAAPTDRLVSVTSIARDTTVSGGGTATLGSVKIVTEAER